MLMTSDLPIHPIADLFGIIDPEELTAIRQFTGTELELIKMIISRNLQTSLGVGPRAMLAARIANVDQGFGPELWKWDGISIARCPIHAGLAGELFGVNRASVTKARMIRKLASPEIVSAVEEGKMSIARAYASTRPAERKHVAAPKMTMDDRAEAHRYRSGIYGHLKTALDELTSLPLPADVAAIARALDRSDLTSRKVPIALKWLQEFAACLSSKS